MSNKQQLKVQVTGVLTHGHGAYVYLQYGQYPCDSNLTVTVLINCLEQISPLPKVLYVQMVTVLDRIRTSMFFLIWHIWYKKGYSGRYVYNF